MHIFTHRWWCVAKCRKIGKTYGEFLAIIFFSFFLKSIDEEGIWDTIVDALIGQACVTVTHALRLPLGEGRTVATRGRWEANGAE